jgi:hypothetical protein
LSEGAWIVLAIAAKVGLLRSSSNLENDPAELHEIRSLVRVLDIFPSLYSGGQSVVKVVNAVISHASTQEAGENGHRANILLQDTAAIVPKGLLQGIVPLSIPKI